MTDVADLHVFTCKIENFTRTFLFHNSHGLFSLSS